MGHTKDESNLAGPVPENPDKSAISLAQAETADSRKLRREAKLWYFNTYAEAEGWAAPGAEHLVKRSGGNPS